MYLYEKCLRTIRCARVQEFVGPDAFTTLAWGNARRYVDLMTALMKEMVG